MVVLGYGKFIKRHRKESGFSSQRQLADATGISSATLSRIEAEVQRPQIDTLRILSEHLKTTTFSDLMEQAGYFEGMTGDKLKGIKDFFNIDKDLDNFIKLGIKQVISLGEEAMAELKKIMVESFGEELAEFGNIDISLSNAIDFIKFADLNVETKELLNFTIHNIIENYKNSDSFMNEREFVARIDLSDDATFHKTKVIIDGRELTEKELKKFVAIVRLDRQD